MAKERVLVPDWILQEALKTQHSANSTWKPPTQKGAMEPSTGAAEGDDGLTLTVLGCGTMGIAILGGVMDSLSSKNLSGDSSGSCTTDSTNSDTPTPQKLPTKFNACVRRPQSAKRIRDELGRYDAFRALTIHENDNLAATKAADVILLGCKPYMVRDIFASAEMKAACAGKLLLSICAGVSEADIRAAIGGEAAQSCTVVRVMPNTAAAVRESMTVVALSDPPLPAQTSQLITWIFSRVGRVVQLPSSNMDACTALCGSGPAFAALFLEGMAAGAVAMGVPRDEAYTMAAQTLRGTTGLVLGGEHPAILKDKVTTPGGCTIGGLLVLEEGCLKGTVAKAVREATVVASQLGQGKQGVNGTRH